MVNAGERIILGLPIYKEFDYFRVDRVFSGR